MSTISKKIRKTSAIILLSLVLTALVGPVLLRLAVQLYLNKNLSEVVEKKSKGNYELTFKGLHLSLTHWGIEISEVSFHPTDSTIMKAYSGENSRQYYTFSSPKVSVQGIKLSELILAKKIDINEILIDCPQLNIHGQSTEDKNKTNKLIDEIKPLVTKIFKSIKIKKVELSNASYDLYYLLGDTKRLSNADNITIGMLDFYTDSTLLPNPNRLFDASDIYLKMNKYHEKLPDSIHSINIENIAYSLKQSVIEANGIELAPLDSNDCSKDRYLFQIPQLKITSPRIKDFYQYNALTLDSLILNNAKIEFWPKINDNTNTEKIDVEDKFSLEELAKNNFSPISIRCIILNNSRVKLYEPRTGQPSLQELGRISLVINDFRLDSLSQNDTCRVFYSKHIDFEASDYEIALGDNLHRARIGRLKLSTRMKSILAEDLYVFPVGENPSRQEYTIDSKCDSLLLDQFDFNKATHQKRLAFQQIIIYNPKIKFIQHLISAKKHDSEKENFFYVLISRYIKGLYANKVVIQKGKVSLQNKTGTIQTGNIESMVNLRLGGFAFDETSTRKTDRLFYANQIELGFENYKMHLTDQLHKLTVGKLTISTRDKKAQIQDLHLSPIANDEISGENIEKLLIKYGRSELYEFTIPQLSLTDAGFHEAFFNKKLSVDSLNIPKAQIYYENFALLKPSGPKPDFNELFNLLSEYLSDIKINTVNFPEGTITFINHNKKGKTISLENKFSLKLENMQMDEERLKQKKLLFSENIELLMRDHLIRLSDNIHVLKAGKIGISTKRQEIFVANAKLYPETSSKGFSSIKWNVQLSVPEIRVGGINIEDFIWEQTINADNLTITSPNIKMYRKNDWKIKKNEDDLGFLLPKEIESISIKKFNLKDGSLKLFSETEAKPYLMAQSDLKMTAANILIVQNETKRKPEFKKGNYTSNLLQINIFPKNTNQNISIDEIIFSTTGGKTKLKNIVAKPRTRDSRINQFELKIPTIDMNGLDLDMAYKKDRLLFDDIEIDKPEISIYNNTDKQKKDNPLNINLFQYIEPYFEAVGSETIKMNKGQITVFDNNGELKFRETASLLLEKTLIDNQKPQGLLHSANYSIWIPKIEKESKMYRWRIDKTHYSSKNQRLTSRNILIEPKYEKDIYLKKIGYQSDYISGKIDSAIIFKPNIERWAESGQITGNILYINGLNINVFRDKTWPFDEKQRPKMLHDLIKSMKTPVSFDSLLISNSRATYSEQTASGNRVGQIHFSDIRLRFSPFSNLKNTNGILPDFIIDGSAMIQDSCRIKTNMHYQMNSPSNLFSVDGSIEPFNMQIMNPIIEPLALISIKSGKVNQFKFNFSGDQSSSNGQLLLGYDNLKISVLEVIDGNTKESKLASFIANNLLLRGKNPRGKEQLHPDEISFRRDSSRSTFNYWWKSVFSGIRNTLGIKDNKQQEEQ